jgi:hypothetical protein
MNPESRRRRAFAIAAVVISAAFVSFIVVGAYMPVERPNYRVLGSLRQAGLVRAYPHMCSSTSSTCPGVRLSSS